MVGCGTARCSRRDRPCLRSAFDIDDDSLGPPLEQSEEALAGGTGGVVAAVTDAVHAANQRVARQKALVVPLTNWLP